MKFNSNNFKDGETLYLYFHNCMKNSSSKCNLGISSDPQHALNVGKSDKIFKITLEKMDVEINYVNEVTTKKIKKFKE